MQRGTPVDVRVGQKSYRVVSSSDPKTLERLSGLVEEKLTAVGSRHPDALVLAALALAHDIDRLERENNQLRHRLRERLTALVARVDDVLEHVDENAEPLAPPGAEPQPAETTV